MLISRFFEQILSFIPQRLDQTDKASPKAFTRQRKLPLPKLITFILSITCSGKSQGVDGKSGEFFKHARRSGLWPDAEAIHRSALTKARQKLPWEVFAELHQQAVGLAYDLWPEREQDQWHGMSVYAIDGSKYQLPASAELRAVFDPHSGLDNPGKGHYPQCLVSTVYDVFRRLPVARTVVPIHQGDERAEAQAMLAQIPCGGILLHDRGYPSFDYLHCLENHYEGYHIFRCPAQSTFPAVERFVQSGQREALIFLDPSRGFLDQHPEAKRGEVAPIRLRAIRLEAPDGTLSVLLSNLLDQQAYPAAQIIELSFRRWGVEDHYRNEKAFLEIETFHSKTENGIRQELFAVLMMSVIARTLMMLSSRPDDVAEPQFKNAIMTLASDAACLVAEQPEVAFQIFQELLTEIARVKYYRPKQPRSAQPRVSRRPISKWQQGRAKMLCSA